MNRTEFITKIGRYLLLALLAVAAAITGSRVASASDCTSCPGKGICRGDTDCQVFLQK